MILTREAMMISVQYLRSSLILHLIVLLRGCNCTYGNADSDTFCVRSLAMRRWQTE